MAERHVPPTPDNFQLFYAYASGENPAVSKIIGDMIAGRRPFTPTVLDDLRERFFSQQRVEKAMTKVGVQMDSTLNAVMETLGAAGRDTSAYGRTLSEASGELTAQKSPDAARKIMDGILDATRAMETRTKELEGELSRASAEVQDLRVKLDDVRKESLTDPLTGIANRKSFDARIAEAVEQARANGQPLSLLMCDIDRFKQFNDTWGHQTGDQVIRLVANCLSENVKGRDTAARYGGEEFAVILPQTGLTDALRVAEHIRAAVENRKLVKKSTGEVLGTITISVGVSQFAAKDDGAGLIRRADGCLYAAKDAGRNCVIADDDPRAARANAAA